VNCLANCTNLTSLELRNCKSLQNVDGLANLTNLTSLNLNWCKSLKNADIIGSLTKLENLNLSCCENLINVDGLANCINLTALELEYCQSLQNIEALAHCTELIVLNLNFRESPLNLNALAGMKNLIKLSLGGHHLSSLSPELGQLVKLEHLRLFGNDFTELFPGFGNLKTMKALDLSYCKNIADDALGPISRLVNLEELDLYGCENISDSGLAHLSKNVNLKRLDLIGTQATEKAVEKLQSRLPELTILWQLFEKNLSLCANPRTDSDQLAEIYNTFITEEPDTTLIDWLSEKIMWEEIEESQRIELAETLAGNPKCTSPVLTDLFDLPDRNEWWGWPEDNHLQLNVLSNPGCPLGVLYDVIKGDNDELKKAASKSPAVKKLKPVGFGRYADPETGEKVAKMQDGKLVAVEKAE
jgi:Leucine-rich repeat (LRR) protein